MDMRRAIFSMGELHRPSYCEKCGGVLVYKGLGEYECEECGHQEYDDYGKVRNYLDDHKGANVAEISEETGVSHKSIRDMIKDNRFEIINNAGGYIRCEMCGANINSGRLCSKCEQLYHRQLEEEARRMRKSGVQGGSESFREETGERRFIRER